MEAPLKLRPLGHLIPTATLLSLECQPIRTVQLPVLGREVPLLLAQETQDSRHKDFPSGQLRIQLRAVVLGFSSDSRVVVVVVVVLTSALLSARPRSSTLVSIFIPLRTSLSGTSFQTLPELVMPLKGHSFLSLSLCSCLPTLSVPSQRFGY